MRNYLISFPMFGESFKVNPPSSFEIFGFTFYFYGLIIALGFLLALLYCMKRCKYFGITQDNFIDMLLFAVPLSIVFARLYFVAFQWQSFAGDPIRIFMIREGGLAVYGSIIGGVIGLVAACRLKKLSPGTMLDLGALGLLIGQSVGRWANFINREAYGSETGVFWRMGLMSPRTGETIYVHPTFLYESLWNVMGFLLLHLFTKKGKRQFDGQIFAMYAAWYGFGRMFIEGLRSDSLYIPGTLIRASQLLAALSFVASMVFLIIMLRRPYRPQLLWVNSPQAAALLKEASDGKSPAPQNNPDGEFHAGEPDIKDTLKSDAPNPESDPAEGENPEDIAGK